MLLQEVNERLERKIQESVATSVTTTLISVPLVILFNYSKAKRFKQDVIGNGVSLKADLDNKSLPQSQAMAWIAQHKNFNEDFYVLAALVCATKLDHADDMLSEFVRDGGGAEKC